MEPVMPRRMSRKEKLLIGVLLAIILAARLYYIYTSPQLKLTHDEIGYHEMTLRYFAHGFLGYYAVAPTAFVTPGYPVFMIIVYYFAGLLHAPLLISVRVVQVIISVGTVFLAYLLARRSAGPAAGFLAVLLLALYHPAYMANNRILTEVLYSFLLLLYLYFVTISQDKQTGLKWDAFAGVVMALAVLVRPSAAPFLLVPYIVRYIMHRDRQILIGMVTALISFSIVMSPWWIRNYLLFDKFIMFATQSGDPLLRGTDPYDVYDKIGPSIMKGVPYAKMTDVAIQRITAGFKTDPWLWIKWFTVGKLSFMWLKPWGVYNTFANTLHLWGFVVLGWLGVFLNLFDRRLRWVSLFVLFMSVLQLVFIPITRYMFPLTHLMAVMAATIVVKFVQKILDTNMLNR